MTPPQTRSLERQPTGVPGLDKALFGGLLTGSICLLIGEPGSGKTVLAHQIGAHHVRSGGRVLYLTALVESHQSLITHASTLSFFDPRVVPDSFYYASLHQAVRQGSLSRVGEEIARLVQDRDPTLLIIDGAHTFRLMGDPVEYLGVISRLQGQSALTGMTTLLLSNASGDQSNDPTMAVPDGIIRLGTVRHELQRLRTFEIEKLRGSGFLSGQHHMVIGQDGIRIHPRHAAVVSSGERKTEVPGGPQRMFGIPRLDEMLGGGISPSTATFLAGPSGSGKTLIGLSFLASARRASENALYVGFHETPDRVFRKARNIGLDLREEDNFIEMIWRPCSELQPDELIDEVLENIDRRNVHRLYIDGFDDIERSIYPPERFMNFSMAMMTMLRGRGLSIIVSQELRTLFGHDVDLPTPAASPLFDNIVLLRYAEIRSDFRRFLSILKTQDQNAERVLREYFIEPTGIRVGDPFTLGENEPYGHPRLEAPDAR